MIKQDITFKKQIIHKSVSDKTVDHCQEGGVATEEGQSRAGPWDPGSERVLEQEVQHTERVAEGVLEVEGSQMEHWSKTEGPGVGKEVHTEVGEDRVSSVAGGKQREERPQKSLVFGQL